MGALLVKFDEERGFLGGIDQCEQAVHGLFANAESRRFFL